MNYAVTGFGEILSNEPDRIGGEKSLELDERHFVREGERRTENSLRRSST